MRKECVTIAAHREAYTPGDCIGRAMTVGELKRLLEDFVVKLREDLCARYTLMDGPGSCCYNDGSHPTEYCPMEIGYGYCMSGDFEDVIRGMLEKKENR